MLRGEPSLWVWEMLWKRLEFDPSCKAGDLFMLLSPLDLSEWPSMLTLSFRDLGEKLLVDFRSTI